MLVQGHSLGQEQGQDWEGQTRWNLQEQLCMEAHVKVVINKGRSRLHKTFKVLCTLIGLNYHS